jgi:predicted DNA-binding ribbon-helix-helix protein
MQSSLGSEASSTPVERKSAPSTLVSRNVTISGHRTSVRLEPEMWSGLAEICRRERAKLHEICTSVAQRKHENTSLTAAIRVFVMAYFRAAATEDGHVKAGHGYNNTIIGLMPSGQNGDQRGLAGTAVNPAALPASSALAYMAPNGKNGNGRF